MGDGFSWTVLGTVVAADAADGRGELVMGDEVDEIWRFFSGIVA